MAARKPKVPAVVLKAAQRADVGAAPAKKAVTVESPVRAKIVKALKKLHPMD